VDDEFDSGWFVTSFVGSLGSIRSFNASAVGSVGFVVVSVVEESVIGSVIAEAVAVVTSGDVVVISARGEVGGSEVGVVGVEDSAVIGVVGLVSDGNGEVEDVVIGDTV